MYRKFCKILRALLLGVGAIALAVNVQAQTVAPKYSNEFLAIGVGARALAMANAQVSLTSDVTAGYWNPAGLLHIKSDYNVSLMHAEYFAGIAKYDYAGFATPIDSVSSLAITAIRFGVDDIPDTRYLYDANGSINYDNIRFFSAADYAFLLSYARKSNLLPGLQLGASAKVVHRTVGEFANAWGFGLDVGAQYSVSKWQFGVMLRDVTTTFNAWSYNSEMFKDVFTQTNNEIPESSIEVTLPKATVGASRSIPINSSFSALLAADLVATFDGKRNVLIKSNFASIDPRVGAEINFKDVAYFRLGLGSFQQVEGLEAEKEWEFQPSGGLGVRLNKVTIDYALTDIGDQATAPYSHVFSLKLDLNKKK